MDTKAKLTLFYDRLSELYHLRTISGILGWDQRVMMPQGAAKGRAAQRQYLALMIHGKVTDPEFAQAVDDLYEVIDILSEEDRVNVRETKRNLDISRKLPEEFVSEMTEVSSMGYSAWVEARPKNDFKAVQPHLEKMVELNKRKAELLGYEEHPYDPLLDSYEQGSKTSIVKPLLLGLAEELRKIIPPIAERFSDVPELQGQYEAEKQFELFRKVAAALGFSFENGRLDQTPHPFSTTLGPSDFRITTRYDEENFLSGLYSTIHETGHALYSMGLPKEWAGTPMGSSVSLAIGESQSRIWENPVGRSREFITYLSGLLKEYFPNDSDPEKLWWQANRVKPSLIRVEADEVTYSQHIVIRMMLEIALVEGEVKVSDLPQAWGDMYEKYLGVRPRDDRNGVMQDVHWHYGGIGYFPTYALGNLYNAMMMDQARQDIPGLTSQIEQGDFSPLRNWLIENIHQHGMKYRGPELIKRITGKELSAGPFVDYLKQKFLA